MNESFLFSNIVLRIIKVISKKKLNKYEFSDNLYFYIEKYIRQIIQNTIKYMTINKKMIMTVYDVKYANIENSDIKYIQTNQAVIKILKIKSNLIPILQRNNFLINYRSSMTNRPREFLFIIKNWFFFDLKKKINVYGNKLHSLVKLNKKYSINSENIAFSLLLSKEFNFYRYILIKIEKGNYIEKDFCLENLSRYKKINILIPHLIIYLNGFMLRINSSFYNYKLIIKVIRAMCINKSSNIICFIDYILPILLKYTIDRFENLTFEEIFSLKNYTANIIGIIYNRLGIRSNQFLNKIIPIFSHIIINCHENIPELYGSIVSIAVLGSKNIELLLFPYSLKIIQFIKLELFSKIIKSKKLIEIKYLYNIITSILLSYCIKKKIKNINKKKNKLLKEIFYMLNKIKKINLLNLTKN